MIVLGRLYPYESPDQADVLVSYEYMLSKGLILEDYRTCYIAQAEPSYSLTKDHKILWVKQGTTDYNEIFNVIMEYTKRGYRAIHNPIKDMSIQNVDHWHLIVSVESEPLDHLLLQAKEQGVL